MNKVTVSIPQAPRKRTIIVAVPQPPVVLELDLDDRRDRDRLWRYLARRCGEVGRPRG